jgi:hypothetical protein
MKLENRPDWQEELDRGMEDIKAGRVISHEEHLNWKRQQRSFGANAPTKVSSPFASTGCYR